MAFKAFLLIAIYFLFANAVIPPPYLIREKSVPPNGPITVRVGIDIYETFMSFDSDTLTIHGSLRLYWRDIRKRYNTTDYNTVSFFSGINDKEYKIVEKNIWVPGLKQQMQLLTFRSSSYFSGETISPFKDGSITYSMRFIMPISCTQISVNYPFESYSCFQILLDSNANKNYVYKSYYPDEDIMKLNFNSKHNGHSITNVNSSVFTKTIDDWDRDGSINVPYLQFGFVVQRVSPRLITTVFTPAIAIGIIDALLFVFSRNLYLNCAMLPAFCLHFQEMTLKNTIEEFPPIVKFFYARFLTSVLCNLWNFLLCISREFKTTLHQTSSTEFIDEEMTADISYFTLLQSFLSTWKRRLCIVLVFLIVFYGILSINLTNIPNTVIKEPNY